jgi:hypothetical protein
MPSSQGEFATCLTMSINPGELRALELRHSSTRKFDGEFGQGAQSYVGAARVRYMPGDLQWIDIRFGKAEKLGMSTISPVCLRGRNSNLSCLMR